MWKIGDDRRAVYVSVSEFVRLVSGGASAEEFAQYYWNEEDAKKHAKRLRDQRRGELEGELDYMTYLDGLGHG